VFPPRRRVYLPGRPCPHRGPDPRRSLCTVLCGPAVRVRGPSSATDVDGRIKPARFLVGRAVNVLTATPSPHLSRHRIRDPVQHLLNGDRRPIERMRPAPSARTRSPIRLQSGALLSPVHGCAPLSTLSQRRCRLSRVDVVWTHIGTIRSPPVDHVRVYVLTARYGTISRGGRYQLGDTTSFEPPLSSSSVKTDNRPATWLSEATGKFRLSTFLAHDQLTSPMPSSAAPGPRTASFNGYAFRGLSRDRKSSAGRTCRLGGKPPSPTRCTGATTAGLSPRS